MSGNGIRCLAQAAVDAGLVSPPRFAVRDPGGVRTVEYTPGESPGWARASVDMGPAGSGRPAPGVRGPPGPHGRRGQPASGAPRAGHRERRHRGAGAQAPGRLRRRDQRGVDHRGERRRRRASRLPGVGAGSRRDAGLRHRQRRRGGGGAELGCRAHRRRRPRAQSRRDARGDPGGGPRGRPRTWPDRYARWPTSTSIRACSLEQPAARDAHRAQLPGAHHPGGGHLPRLTTEAVDEELDELAQLVDSAGADVVGRVVQRRDSPDPATFVGRGKAEEIAELSRSLDADTVVFDDELPRPSAATSRSCSAAPPSTGRRSSSTSSPRTPAVPRARRRSSSRCCATGCRDCGAGGLAEPAGGGDRDPGAGRDPARGGPPAPRAPHAPPRGGPARRRTHTVAAAPQPRPRPPARAGARGLHQCGEVDTAEPADRRRGPRGEPPLRHARPAHPTAVPPGWGDGPRDRHGRLRAQAAARAGRGVPLHARFGAAWPTWSCTSSTPPRQRRGPDGHGPRGVGRDRCRRRARVGGRQQSGQRTGVGQGARAHDGGLGAHLGPHRRGGRRAATRRRRPAAGLRPGRAARGALVTGRRPGRHPS